MHRSLSKLLLIFIFLSGLLYYGCSSDSSDEVKGVEHAKLTYAPFVPKPITRDHPTKVVVRLEIEELVARLADGVEYTKWTFGGRVPGQFIRIREGDEVEFHLYNHTSSTVPHNIDLHAVNGPGGGAEATFTTPGETSTFSFKALNPGLYIYHCAVPPVGMHIANGMYGLILVEPEGGLPKVDREYYVVQSEFYTEGNYGEPGLQPYSHQKALDENPPYVVFNGEVGAISGEKALKANVGEKVRLFVGNGGPNLVSSFHVIGEILDRVYPQGATTPILENVQTTLVPAGGSVIVEFEVEVPGKYLLVDHSIFRAFDKGALGELVVTGPENKKIFSGKHTENPYPVSGGMDHGMTEHKTENDPTQQQAKSGDDMTQLMKLGQNVYTQNCASCHQANGQGIPNAFPPLANSDYLMQDKERSIRAVLKGLSGPITVNGKKYNSVMLPVNLNNEQTAAVLTYVRNSWGNKGEKVTAEEVQKVRSAK